MDMQSNLVKAVTEFVDFGFDVWHTAHFEDATNHGMMTMIHTTEETNRDQVQDAVNKAVKEHGYHEDSESEFFAGATVATVYDGTTTFIIYESYGRKDTNA